MKTIPSDAFARPSPEPTSPRSAPAIAKAPQQPFAGDIYETSEAEQAKTDKVFEEAATAIEELTEEVGEKAAQGASFLSRSWEFFKKSVSDGTAQFTQGLRLAGNTLLSVGQTLLAYVLAPFLGNPDETRFEPTEAQAAVPSPISSDSEDDDKLVSHAVEPTTPRAEEIAPAIDKIASPSDVAHEHNAS